MPHHHPATAGGFPIHPIRQTSKKFFRLPAPYFRLPENTLPKGLGRKTEHN